MDFGDIKKAHFVGVGGIGMSALAQLLVHEGIVVSSSDTNASPVTIMLEQKGISVSIGQRIEDVPQDADVIVYSDAVDELNPDFMKAVRALGIPTYSYFQMLGKVSAGKRTVAVAGTHGKTTTTGMLAKILIDAGASPTVVVGSIVKDFGSNYVAGQSDLFVVEACEYRDHLLELSPEVLIVNNLEWDHTDFFPSLAALQETFRKAIAKVPAHGAIITNPSNPNIAPLLSVAAARIVDYTAEPAFSLLLPGAFNQMNARAAAAAARAVLPSIADDAIAMSLSSFHGTWRRFEYKGQT
ncbi:MAG TPA: Mur ligase domain-containing protein, partial [Candidatus Paceibacterota bacterium]